MRPGKWVGSIGFKSNGFGQKMNCLKWVTQLMTHTRSFKGQVKIGLTRIFTHENIYNPKLSFSFLCLPFNTNKRTHKQKHSQIKEYGKNK